MKNFKTVDYIVAKTRKTLNPDMNICQQDYPLDWYQEEFIPYAEEFQALPDRKMSTILKWMERYIIPAQKYFGDKLLLLSHFYMGGEIVKLIEEFGGIVGDSYQLALMATNNPNKEVIVESAVHFMAESISVLAKPNQTVYITNPKAGCTMEMLAKDFMVEPAFLDLSERYGTENILPICYMNTSGRIKAMTGELGGAVCTSSNVKKIFEWAREKNKKIFFIPDKHMGENVASWVGIPPDNIAYWPGGTAGAQFNLLAQDEKTLAQFDKAELVLFSSECGVHSYYTPEMVKYWQDRDYHVVVHPECRKVVVDVADSSGSTAFIWQHVTNDTFATKKYAIGTEDHLVENIKTYCQDFGIEVVNLGMAKVKGAQGMGCGCATMSRNDPPHLVAILDLLRQGKAPEYNIVKPGDVVNEFTGTRQRLDDRGQDWLVENARKALENMVKITESA